MNNTVLLKPQILCSPRRIGSAGDLVAGGLVAACRYAGQAGSSALEEVNDALATRILIMDGAMGTMLQSIL